VAKLFDELPIADMGGQGWDFLDEGAWKKKE
jgi:hypothetical protein